jgi:TRAP transporter TAXI family solute receptor
MKTLFAQRMRANSAPENQKRGGIGTVLTSAATLDFDTLEEMMNRRVRTMLLRYTWLTIGFVILLIGAIIYGSVIFSAKLHTLRIAAGPAGGDAARFAQLLTQQFKRDRASTRLNVVSTNGPADSAAAIDKNQTDLAIVRSDVGIGQNGLAVAILGHGAIVLLQPASGTRDKKTTRPKAPKIEKISALAGKTVGIVKSEATADQLNVVLKHYGVPVEKVTVVDVDPADLATAIKENKVDVLMVAGQSTGKAIADTVAAASKGKNGPNFIEIDEAEAIVARNPAYDNDDIAEGTFGGATPQPTDKLTTLTYSHYIVGRKGASGDRIADFSKTLYADRQTLAHDMPGIKIEAPSTDKDATVPVHPGTADYLSDSQKSFFDKYGDDIFYGMMIIPIFGSAIAGVASYFRADNRTRRIRLLHRMLRLIRRIRSVTSLEELEKIQLEADGMMSETIHEAERGQIDETALPSFALVIDQVQQAITSRRLLLLEHANELANVEPPLEPQSEDDRDEDEETPPLPQAANA